MKPVSSREIFAFIADSLASVANASEVVVPHGQWRNVLTEDEFDCGSLMVDKILSRFPVAPLTKEQ